jgi:hypothetical protein
MEVDNPALAGRVPDPGPVCSSYEPATEPGAGSAADPAATTRNLNQPAIEERPAASDPGPSGFPDPTGLLAMARAAADDAVATSDGQTGDNVGVKVKPSKSTGRR